MNFCTQKCASPIPKDNAIVWCNRICNIPTKYSKYPVQNCCTKKNLFGTVATKYCGTAQGIEVVRVQIVDIQLLLCRRTPSITPNHLHLAMKTILILALSLLGMIVATYAACDMSSLLGCAGSSFNGNNNCAYDTNGKNWCIADGSAPSGSCRSNYVGPPAYSFYATPVTTGECPRCGINCFGPSSCNGGNDGCGVCHKYSGQWGDVYKCASS